MNGYEGETEQIQQYRTYYDAWVVRNMGGPGQPGEWVKELRYEVFGAEDEAVRYGERMTADAHRDRPTSFYVVFEVVNREVIFGRDA